MDGYASPVVNVELADPNLRLALLDEVYTARVGDYYWLSSLRDEYVAYQVAAGGPEWDELHQRLGVDPVPELERFLLTLPLTADDLANVADLRLDGDREIYTLYPGWWHFGDHFTIASLDGIGHCAALTDLDLGQGMAERCSLTPLAELPGLDRLSLCALGRHRDLDVLSSLPALTELTVFNVATAEEREAWGDVIGRLRARGVTVHGG